MIYRILLLVLLLCLTACSAQSPRDEAATSALPSAGVTPAAVSSPPSIAGDAGIVYGRNDDGTFFHGAANAPVTLIDYSDFL